MVLDDLTSASTCDLQVPKFLQALFRGVLPQRFMQGSIPACIWKMPSLETLHLSGNGLTGTLGELLKNSSLQALNLASNHFSGPIPLSFQANNVLLQLDLSRNRLDGTLSSHFVVTNSTELKLTVNRFSGFIPHAFYELESLTVVNGNLFNCGPEGFPPHDPHSSQFSCGSDTFDAYLFTWLAVTVVCAGGACLILQQKSRWHWIRLSSTESMNSLGAFELMTKKMSQLCVLLTVLLVCVSMMSYITLKSGNWSIFYSTHTFQYTWVTTVAYLHGILPAILVMVYIAVGVSGVALLSQVICGREFSVVSLKKYSRIFICQHRALMVMMHVVHLAVVLTVNASYVVAVIRGLPPATLALVQFSLAVYKVCWGNILIPFMLRSLTFLSKGEIQTHYAFMIIASFIGAPLISTFFSDSSCFLNVLVASPAVVSTYPKPKFECMTTCSDNNNCSESCGFYPQFIGEQALESSVIPGWLYSYQCSSALLSNYVPVLVLCFVMLGLVFPTIQLLYLLASPDSLEGFVSNDVRRWLIDDTIHAWKWIPSHLISSTTNPVRANNKISMRAHDIVLNSIEAGDNVIAETDSSVSSMSTETEKQDEAVLLTHRTMLFDSTSVVSKFLLDITVILTFGLASPLLAVIVVMDACNLVLLWRILICRYCVLCGEAGDPLWARLSCATDQCSDGVKTGLQVSVAFVCLFWSIFIFDMLGDVYGDTVGLVTMMFFTACLFLMYMIATNFFPLTGKREILSLAKHEDHNSDF